jgi:hypothetical protein
MNLGMNGYIGSWVSAGGQKLIIEKRSRRTLAVSIIGIDGRAIMRPYMNQAPCEKLIGRFDDIEGFLEVDLWYPKSGFILSLFHDFDPPLNGIFRDYLSPGLGRYEGDVHLDAYYTIFGNLDSYFPEPNQAVEPTIIRVTDCAPSSTLRATYDRGSL